MKKLDSAMESGDRVLIRLRQRAGLHRGQLLSDVPYYLADAILEHHSFETIECLIAFCENPDNLKPWLPSEADRIVFSHDLVQRLHELRTEASARPRASSHQDGLAPVNVRASCST